MTAISLCIFLLITAVISKFFANKLIIISIISIVIYFILPKEYQVIMDDKSVIYTQKIIKYTTYGYVKNKELSENLEKKLKENINEINNIE